MDIGNMNVYVDKEGRKVYVITDPKTGRKAMFFDLDEAITFAQALNEDQDDDGKSNL